VDTCSHFGIIFFVHLTPLLYPQDMTALMSLDISKNMIPSDLSCLAHLAFLLLLPAHQGKAVKEVQEEDSKEDPTIKARPAISDEFMYSRSAPARARPAAPVIPAEGAPVPQAKARQREAAKQEAVDTAFKEVQARKEEAREQARHKAEEGIGEEESGEEESDEEDGEKESGKEDGEEITAGERAEKAALAMGVEWAEADHEEFEALVMESVPAEDGALKILAKGVADLRTQIQCIPAEDSAEVKYKKAEALERKLRVALSVQRYARELWLQQEMFAAEADAAIDAKEKMQSLQKKLRNWEKIFKPTKAVCTIHTQTAVDRPPKELAGLPEPFECHFELWKVQTQIGHAIKTSLRGARDKFTSAQTKHCPQFDLFIGTDIAAVLMIQHCHIATSELEERPEHWQSTLHEVIRYDGKEMKMKNGETGTARKYYAYVANEARLKEVLHGSMSLSWRGPLDTETQQLQISFSVRLKKPNDTFSEKCTNLFSRKLYRRIFLRHAAKEYKEQKLEARITEDPRGVVLKEISATVGVDFNPFTGVGVGVRLRPKFQQRGRTPPFTRVLKYEERVANSIAVPIESFGQVYVSVYLVDEQALETRLLRCSKVSNHGELVLSEHTLGKKEEGLRAKRFELRNKDTPKVKLRVGGHGNLLKAVKHGLQASISGETCESGEESGSSCSDEESDEDWDEEIESGEEEDDTGSQNIREQLKKMLKQKKMEFIARAVRPLVERKLATLSVVSDDIERVLQAMVALSPNDLLRVFDAGESIRAGPKISKVEALLAATGLSNKEVLGMVGRAAKPLVQRKLEEVGVQPEDVTIVSTAIEALLTKDNTQKLQAVFAAAMPLVQGPVTVSKVEALLLVATGLSNKEVLGMVGRAAKPLVQRKLEEVGVQPEDVTIVSTAIEALLADNDNKQKLQAVFAAAMPLVQGPVTVSKVEALLQAAGISKEQVLGMVGRAAKPLVQCKLEEVGVQPEDVTIVSAVLFELVATDEPKLQAVFAAAMPLVHGPVTVSKVEALLQAVGLTKEQVLAVVDRAANPLVQRKLEEMGVQPEDVATVSAVLLELVATDKPKLQAVFAAAMPLVQGPVTVSKVEALLQAVGLTKEQVLALVGRAAKPLVQRKLEEVGVQPQDVATVSTATENGKNKTQVVMCLH
jgi:hypothetical protein